MKTTRILTTVLCAIAIVAMYGCGGSSYLSESPELQDFLDNAVVRIDGTGWDHTTTSGQAKAYFVDDAFTGDGTLTGEDLSETIDMKCQFAQPVAIDLDDAGPLGVVSDLFAVDLASCVDPRNCCIYSVDGAWVDACTIDVACVLDPDDTVNPNLKNTGIGIEFQLEQVMATNMRDDTGLIATAIEEVSAGVSDIMDLSAATIDRSGCADAGGGVPQADGIIVNNDDAWSGEASINADDVLADGDALWNADTIGAVAPSGGVGDLANCTIYYTGITGVVSLEPVSNYDALPPDDVDETIDIDGAGMICNDRSVTNCEADNLYTF